MAAVCLYGETRWKAGTRELRDRQPIVAAMSAGHTGTFNMGEAADRWKPFTSTQRMVTRSAGFVWDGCVSIMPGLRVRVHDAYGAGEGILQAAVQGIIPGKASRIIARDAWWPSADTGNHRFPVLEKAR